MAFFEGISLEFTFGNVVEFDTEAVAATILAGNHVFGVENFQLQAVHPLGVGQ